MVPHSRQTTWEQVWPPKTDYMRYFLEVLFKRFSILSKDMFKNS